MLQKCQAQDPSLCAYHKRTLVTKDYRELLSLVKQANTETKAMQTIVQATNMNPEVLLKDAKRREQNILSRVDSTPEGQAYLKEALANNREDIEIYTHLLRRKQTGLLLAQKRIRLSEEIEQHKRVWLPTARGKKVRVSILASFVQNKIDTLKGATKQFSELDDTVTNPHVLSNFALITELEEIHMALRPELV